MNFVGLVGALVLLSVSALCIVPVHREETTRPGCFFYHVDTGLHYHVSERREGTWYLKCVFYERGCRGRAILDQVDGLTHTSQHTRRDLCPDRFYPDEIALRRAILQRCATLEYVSNIQILTEESHCRICGLSDDDSVKKEDIRQLFFYLSRQTIFEGVQSKYKQEKYQKLRWNAVVPRKIVFTWKKALVHGKVCKVPDKVAYYMDFLQQLELVLQCEDILYCVDHPKPPSEEFRSALDGYAYQNHPIAQKYPNALAIIYYLDDIKAGDTLSSYPELALRNYLWSLANVYPELRSSLRAIHLQALCKASVAKSVKNGPIIKNFIEGINKLSSEEGVTFNIKGVPRVFHGFLLFVVGDFPALANIGGFKESASFAWRFCRQCMITQNEMSSKFEESEVTLRTEAMHQHHLEIMEGTCIDEEDEHEETEQREKPTVEFGINCRSPLLQIRYFNLTQSLPQDIMHLFLEGIMETECRLLLNHAISTKKLPREYVNFMLDSYSSGKDMEKPSPIESQHLKNGLRQTSGQILMISTVLPFIVQKHCDADRLKNFLLLQMIFRLCISHVLLMPHATLLKRMIRKYLINFIILNPGCFTAKHHFLIHLPTQLILFSILTEQWAMRFEGFHAILKRLAKVLHTAKNLSCSLMLRMSSLMAFKIHKHQADYLTKGAIKPRVQQTMPLSQVPHQDKIVTCLKLVDDCEATQLKSLKWYGPVLSQGDTILLTPSMSASGALPKFATVLEIFCIQKRYVVLYKELSTISYSANLNAYQIEFNQGSTTEAMDITNNCNISKLLNIRHEDANYIVIKQDSNPHFVD